MEEAQKGHFSLERFSGWFLLWKRFHVHHPASADFTAPSPGVGPVWLHWLQALVVSQGLLELVRKLRTNSL